MKGVSFNQFTFTDSALKHLSPQIEHDIILNCKDCCLNRHSSPGCQDLCFNVFFSNCFFDIYVLVPNLFFVMKLKGEAFKFSFNTLANSINIC